MRLFIELLSGGYEIFGHFVVLFFYILILFFKVLYLCCQLQKLFQLLVCYLHFFLLLFGLFYLLSRLLDLFNRRALFWLWLYYLRRRWGLYILRSLSLSFDFLSRRLYLQCLRLNLLYELFLRFWLRLSWIFLALNCWLVHLWFFARCRHWLLNQLLLLNSFGLLGCAVFLHELKWIDRFLSNFCLV